MAEVPGVPGNIECNLFVATETREEKVEKSDETKTAVYGYKACVQIPKNAFVGTSLENRDVEGVTMPLGGAGAGPLSIRADFVGLFEMLGEDSTVGKDLDNVVKKFVKVFLPWLEKHGKHKQLLAELKNLEHIKSCANEMLNEDGLNFEPEFVANILIRRFEITMFGFSKGEDMQVGEGQYEPVSMFDFGEDRSFANVPEGNYLKDGRPASPNIKIRGRITHRGSDFSFIRGVGRGNKLGEDYIMPGEKATSCLSRRFRQYLAYITGDKNILGIDRGEAVLDLPPAMMFLVGLQFGQNNIGSWNPFTLAAKRYLTSQCRTDAGGFFWGSDEQAEDIGHPFSPLHDLVSEEVEVAIDADEFAGQCEIALCAYYAMNQEILSRVKFPGNNRQNCKIGEFFRLEGMDSLVGLGVVAKGGDGSYAAAKGGIAANARRSIMVSSSAGMFVNSLDKPSLFPPPVKVITKYENVHHARVFGSHLFNVDLGEANRPLPGFFTSKTHTTYEKGCPFFKDRQHEFLMMPRGCAADIVGILVWAKDISECYVWSRAGCLPNGVGEVIHLDEIKRNCLKEKITSMIADDLDLNVNVNDREAVANAVRNAGQSVADKITEEGIVSIMPRKGLQTNFADLTKKGIGRLCASFGRDGDDRERRRLILYRDQLKAVKDTYVFNELYDCSYEGMRNI